MINTKVILTFFISTACFNSFVSAQLMSDSLLVDGYYRTVHFNKPSNNTKGNSLIFVLHGSGGNGKDMMKRAGKLHELSASENFLLVFPDG